MLEGVTSRVKIFDWRCRVDPESKIEPFDFQFISYKISAIREDRVDRNAE